MERTLAIDIGGTGLKMICLDEQGGLVTERTRVLTPQPATVEAVLAALEGMDEPHRPYARISVGFPGVVVDGVVKTAANLDPSWSGHDLARSLRDLLGKPARVCNDADQAGHGVIEGTGVELVVTLGTGFGSALFVDGRLVPNLELGHHPFRKGKTYEEVLGKAGLARLGKTKWTRRLHEAIEQLRRLFNFRRLYVGGGNAKKIREPGALPEDVVVVDNAAGLVGGIALWRE